MGQRSKRVTASSPSASVQKLSTESLSTEGTWTPTFGVQGLDVSAHQPSIDWQQQWNMGARFAYVKASEGNYYTNELFGSQYQDSRSVGMIRGAYHFAIPNWSSGADQARYFVANGGGWTADGYTMPPVLDFEFNPYAGRTINGFYFGDTCYGMSGSQLASWVRDFGNTMQALTGRLPAIYTNTSWWNQCLGTQTGFGDYPLWVAAYPSSPSDNAGAVPAGWSNYSLWQYSSTGPLAGDSNVWNGDYDSLRRFAGVPSTGAFDSVSTLRVNDGSVYLRATGWSVDLARMTSSTDVHIYVTDPNNITTGFGYLANGYRPDVDQALGYGPLHGFDQNIRITKSGTYKVCAYAIGMFGNTALGCKDVQAVGVEPPVGSNDALGQIRTQNSASLFLTGWAVDLANPQSSTFADAYVTAPNGQTTGYRITADAPRPDVDSATHLGPNHGFNKSIDINQIGTYKACVFAIGQYANSPLGCKEINVTASPSPIGSYDGLAVSQAPGSAALQVSGWALDPSFPAGSIPVHVYVRSPDGTTVGTAFVADIPRPDVQRALQTVGNHGFQAAIPLNRTGTYTVCSYAIPISPLSLGNTPLGCKNIEVTSTPTPVGYLDTARLQTLAGQTTIRVDGWSFDPAVSAASNPVHVYVTFPDGTRKGWAFAANISRPDVNGAFGVAGNHGYSVAVPTGQRGLYSVCAYGIGIAEFSTGNALLGCQTLNY